MKRGHNSSATLSYADRRLRQADPSAGKFQATNIMQCVVCMGPCHVLKRVQGRAVCKKCHKAMR